MTWWQWVITALIVVSLVKELPARKSKLKEILRIWGWIRPSSAAWAFLALFMASLTIGLLLQVPYLHDITWLAFFSSDSTNIVVAPIRWGGWMIAVVHLPLLFLLLPELARYEEQLFRKGGNTIQSMFGRSLGFGLVHMIVGVSLMVALGLAAGGAVFHVAYLRAYRRELRKAECVILERAKKQYPKMKKVELTWVKFEPGEEAGVRASTAAHLAYNTFILSLLTLSLFL